MIRLRLLIAIGADTIPKVGDEYREEVRRRVVEAALDVFSRSGYHDARMDEIAERASVSKGTLYNQYASKEDLFRGVAEYLLRLEGESYAAIPGDSDPVRQFRALYGWMDDFFADKASLIFEVYAIASRDRQMHDIMADVLARETGEFAEFIAARQAEGKIRRDVDPRSLSFLLISMCMGLMVCSRLDGRSADDALDIGLRSVLFENPGAK